MSDQDPPRYSRRHAEILRIVREEGTATIAGLADRFGVSQESIRRDVKPLTVLGELVRLHGAVTLPHHAGEAPFQRRLRENAEAKRVIARLAADQIADGDSVMLDTGTTTSLLARELMTKRRLTVVTNSSDIARTLSTVNDNTVYMAGGELRGDNGAAFGTSAIEFVSRFRVRHAIISIGGLNPDTGAMDYNLEEAEFARIVLTCGECSTIVTDHSKFGRVGLVTVCGLEGFDRLVTDVPPVGDLLGALVEAGVEILSPPDALRRTG
jgi:DeoR family glycerol-3-phosphate regulon repressor